MGAFSFSNSCLMIEVEENLEESIVRRREVTIKPVARILVALFKTLEVWAPKTFSAPPPPKMLAVAAPFPLCKRTATIRKREKIM